jgi:hypothetical protein
MDRPMGKPVNMVPAIARIFVRTPLFPMDALLSLSFHPLFNRISIFQHLEPCMQITANSIVARLRAGFPSSILISSSQIRLKFQFQRSILKETHSLQIFSSENAVPNWQIGDDDQAV